jgi:ankyrin repeat protein
MNSRKNDVVKPEASTCVWLPQHPVYQRWITQKHGLLWIKGKPGAGKSTVLKYAFDIVEKEEAETSIVASFFFHGRGALIQKSPLGLYKTLLHQILQKIPDLMAKLALLYKSRCQTEGKFGEKWAWQERDLQDFFEAHIPNAAKKHTIRIFVDALDECGEQVASHLVDVFERITSAIDSNEASLGICFSCRHYPVVALENGLEVCVENENSHDIEIYVKHKIEARIRPKKNMEVIREAIVQKSQGSFQWAVLVVPKVFELHKRGKNLVAMQRHIQETPSDLGRLYEELLRGIDEQDKPQSLYLMQWICFAIQPLSLEELRFAMTLGSDNGYTSIRECRGSVEFSETDEETEKRIRDLSRGLAEVGYHEDRQVAQFIHQSVKDFLLEEGLQLLEEFSLSSVAGCSHYQLARSCLRYLSMEEIQTHDFSNFSFDRVDPEASSAVDCNFSFLRYCTTSWILHSKAAEEEGYQQSDLLRFLAVSTDVIRQWIDIYKIIYRYEITYPRCGFTAVHVASMHGFLSILGAALTQKAEADLKDEYDRTPLSYAAENGHEAIVKLLLERDDVDFDSKDNIGRTPLSYAAKNGYVKAVKPLLERNDVDADSKDIFSQTPLLYAARYGHEAIVKLLLERDDVDVDSKDDIGRTPLSYAAGDEHDAVVNLLLERGAEADSKDKKGQTPLSHAAENGREAIVKLLLELDDVDIDSKDNIGRTPLSYAAKYKRNAVVKLLLERNDVDADSKDKDNRSPLLLAVMNRYEATVRLLLERNDVDADSKDKDSRSPLLWAAMNGYEAIVRLLLERNDVYADSKDKDSRSPLLWAAMNGYEAIVRLLLERNDVYADSKDKDSRSPLLWAAMNGHEAIVRLLLERNDVYADSKDKDSRSPLLWATMNGHEAIVRLLLERNDVDVDSKNKDGQTPLSYAAMLGQEAVVKLLLERGAKADSKNKDGQTPLSYAVKYGHEAVVEILRI